MITNNPFSTLAETIPSVAMQGFVIAMAALTLVGVVIDIPVSYTHLTLPTSDLV